MNNGFVNGFPQLLLQVEGATIFGATCWSYLRLNIPWTWYTAIGIFFFPDLGMLGFIVSNKLGSITYNMLHTETPAVVLLCAAWARKDTSLMALGLLWLGHIAFDRMICAGLKYETGFAHTHLGGGVMS
ncbi:hypothetical protein FDECE_853 [Fusarium decemcellulare]|nr:hypothetical protein FDECE_853 [Fusarium decemcellulare]